MRIFEALVATPDGSLQRFTAASPSQHAFLADLAVHNLLLIKMRPALWTHLRHIWARLNAPTIPALIVLFEHLERLDRAGFSLIQSLTIVRSLTGHIALQHILFQLHATLTHGQLLSTAMARTAPHLFSPLLRAFIETAEQTGRLSIGFQNIVRYLRQKHEMRQKIEQSLRYPLVMLLAILGVLFLFIHTLVPRMLAFLPHTQSDTSWLERLAEFDHALTAYGFAFSLLIVALILSLFTLIRLVPQARLRWGYFLIQLPFVGTRLQFLEAARFLSTFALLFDQKPDVLWCLSHAENVVQNAAMRQAIQYTAKRMSQGISLSSALRETRCFPLLVIETVTLGETTGLLAPSLHLLSETYVKTLERWTESLATWLPILLTLLGGGLILLLTLTCLEPLYTIAYQFN